MKSTWVALAVVSIAIWQAPNVAAGEAKSQAPDQEEFARQWREVREKYPLVAVAYLKSVSALLDTTLPIEQVDRGQSVAVSCDALKSLGFRQPLWICSGTTVPCPCPTQSSCYKHVTDTDPSAYIECILNRFKCRSECLRTELIGASPQK